MGFNSFLLLSQLTFYAALYYLTFKFHLKIINNKIHNYNPCADALPMISPRTSDDRETRSSAQIQGRGHLKWDAKSLAKLLRKGYIL